MSKKAIDKQAVIKWATDLLAKNDWYVLDVETTGKNHLNDEIVEMTMLAPNGSIIYSGKIKPVRRKAWKNAEAIHRIKPDDVKNAPTITEVWEKVYPYIKDKTAIIYNAEFDTAMVAGALYTAGCKDKEKLAIKSECLMLKYAAYVGEWNPKYKEYKWQKMPGSTHKSIDDCRAALRLIQDMAFDIPTAQQNSGCAGAAAFWLIVGIIFFAMKY